MQHRKFLLYFALLIVATAPGFAAVEIYNTSVSSFAPAYIDYTLNCPADVTIEILPCDLTGTPTGPAVKTVTFPGQSKGPHRYIWLGDTNSGGTAPYGYYAPRITANAVQPQWGPISGLYLNSDWTHEYAPRPLPSVPDTEGFYGIGINKNPNSAYYGRMYVTHKIQKDVFMYGPDGSYLGKFDDSTVAWGASAPWDLAVADDGWVYVSDRSNMLVHCFDGAGNYVSTSPTIAINRAIFARTTPDGRTHVFVSGGATGIKRIIVEPDHVTWTQPIIAYNTGGGDGWDAYGMWVSPDLGTIYQACNQGPSVGLTRWHDPESDGAYVRDAGWTSTVGACIDVDYVAAPGGDDYMWVTKSAAYANDNPTTTENEYSRAVFKVNAATGAANGDPYDIVSWGHMICADAVGNPAITFGKATPVWAQRYWGLFAEAGNSTSQKLLPAIMPPPSDGCPIVVPGSAVWTPDNVVAGDGADSASVSFNVMDPNGWADVTSVTLDLRPIGYQSNAQCTLTQDLSDPMGKTVIATKTGIKAAVGARCTTSYGQLPHCLAATACDSTNCCTTDEDEVQLDVTGDPTFDAYIRHRRVANWYVDSAQIVAVGGGIPGATDPRAMGPFTYTSAPSASNGYASFEMSAGTFAVKAQKAGFGSETPINVYVPYTGYTVDLYLRPLTVAECRATAYGTKVNVEGVCFAQPVGYDALGAISAYGLAPRTDTGVLRNQWYVCDPNSPANGMLFMVTAPNASFEPQWNYLTDIFIFPPEPPYIGKRPEVGETTMITGILDTPAGHERRVLVENADLLTGLSTVPSTVDRTYLNRGNVGGYPPSPIVVPLTEVAHDITAAFRSSWGKYVQVNDVTVVKIHPIGDDNPSGEAVPYCTVADMLGNSAEIAIQTPATLGMEQWLLAGFAPDLGCTYSIRGAAGRRNRFGNGCIRVRGYGDFELVPGSCIPGPFQDLASLRGLPSGSQVCTTGIVTAKIGTSLWIEAADRSSGMRMTVNPSYVAVGDQVQVSGTIELNDGERVIVPGSPITVASSGNTVPAPLDMRTRQIGGAACGEDPGVANGRGALNVGLLVHTQGMVTETGTGYFYIWDGANHTDAPVTDGIGQGIRIEAAPPAGLVAWQDWMDVTGVVSTDASLVPGRIAPTIIATAVSKVTAFDAIEVPSGQVLKAGWNLLGLPAAPAATGDGDEWTPKPWAPYMVLSPNQDPDAIDLRLMRWENCTGGLYIYDGWNEWEGPGFFGGALLGDGYWLTIEADWPVSYSGKRSSLDQWIDICSPGWALIGHPKDHPTYLSDVKVHTGNRVLSMYDAVMTEGWIDCIGYWWDSEHQGLIDVGLPDCFCTADHLLPWHGYWLQVYRGDMALIVPESPQAP